MHSRATSAAAFRAGVIAFQCSRTYSIASVSGRNASSLMRIDSPSPRVGRGHMCGEAPRSVDFGAPLRPPSDESRPSMEDIPAPLPPNVAWSAWWKRGQLSPCRPGAAPSARTRSRPSGIRAACICCRATNSIPDRRSLNISAVRSSPSQGPPSLPSVSDSRFCFSMTPSSCA